MNYLVFLDPQASELEKILSGTKSMVVMEFDPARLDNRLINPGDGLYFLRAKVDVSLRVQATAVRTLVYTNGSGENYSHILKEMQAKLQLTEDQYNYWSEQKQFIMIEFTSAHKISEIKIASKQIEDQSDWIAFEDIKLISE